MLETIQYRLNIKSFYQEAAIIIKSLNNHYKKDHILPQHETVLHEYLYFLGMLVAHSVDLRF